MNISKLWFSLLLVIVIFIVNVSPGIAKVEQQEPITYSVLLKNLNADVLETLIEQGIPIDGLDGGQLVAFVTQIQLDALRSLGIEFEILKPNDMGQFFSGVGALSGVLSNSYLTISINDTGRFTMWTSDGRYLLYPSPNTGAFSVKVDNNVYTNRTGTLTVSTPLTFIDSTTAFIKYTTPEKILITQRYTLSGQAVQFKVEVQNKDTKRHTVSVRYLLDTQVDNNDGSPLYAPSVGVRTYETNIPSVSFSTWTGYDTWPSPTLISTGSFATRPDRVVFAWWPDAIGFNWDYAPDPNQIFYTPGYTTSPNSDSCVLLYFGLGSLGADEQAVTTTYYGVGKPQADTDRERLILALENFKEATKSSIKTDLNAFSALQAKYIVSLRNDWADYLEASWAIIGLALPDPSDLAKLGKNAKVLEEYAKAINWVDTANTAAMALDEILSSLPANATETEIKDKIYSEFMNNVRFTPDGGPTYTGIDKYLKSIDTDFQSYVNQIPDPLPANYPVDWVIDFLQKQTSALYASGDSETYVPFYYPNQCGYVKLGVLQYQKKTMTDLAGNLEVAGTVSLITTVTEITVYVGAGGLKLAGFVGTPLTAGGSVVVTEAAFWGAVANIELIASGIGAISDLSGLAVQDAMAMVSYAAVMQLANDLALRGAVFQRSGEWAVDASALALSQQGELLTQESLGLNSVPSSIQVESISIPDLIMLPEATTGQGTGSVFIRNIGGAPVTVTMYGNVTTEVDGEMPIVGLVGSSSISLEPGEGKNVEFSYSLIRSSLLHYSGYDVHLLAAVTGVGGDASLRGPFVGHLYAGTFSQLATLNGQSFETVDRGELADGQTITNSVQFDARDKLGRLVLSFPEGSDYDLHLYDGNGRHFGINYSTGNIDNQIPGVIYSGSTSWPEWMIIEDPGIGTYQVKIVGQNSDAGDGYDLSRLNTPLLPAILDTPARVSINGSRGTGVPIDVTIYEGGGGQGVSNLQISFSDFQSANRYRGRYVTIPASKVACSVPAEVPAGSSVLARCWLKLPKLPLGISTFKSVIQITGEDSNGNLLTVITQLSVNIFDTRKRISR